MSCAENLRDLLSPLGIYRWEGSFQWGELQSAGAALDAVAEELGHLQREMDLTRAEDTGLAALCSLLGREYSVQEPEKLREILAAVLRIHSGSITLEALQDALRGCGIQAELEEAGDGVNLTVAFPRLIGPGEDWPQVQDFLETVLPCHVGVQYRFRSMNWSVLEETWPTWTALEAGVARWSEIG